MRGARSVSFRHAYAALARRFKGNAMSWGLGQELNWDAPWVDVCLRVELPFWLMVDNTTISIEVGGHTFPVALHGETFELHGKWISDSKEGVAYQGPLKKNEDLSENIQKILRENPDLNILWRKCKTVLKITTRCNEDVWKRAQAGGEHVRPVSLYLEELCRAHMPVVNRLIQGYRLATYDYFAFEVAPWDVPYWHIERGARAVRCILFPYRGWDHRPMVQLIEGEQLQSNFTTEATPGEFELLDALNLIERGDYSGAVRRVTTAIEVVVEAVLERALITAEGNAAAAKFLKDTRRDFLRRVTKYESLSGRTLSHSKRSTLETTRRLRHEIVHKGYRIASGERGNASKAVDTGRWTFNWFENDDNRRAVREKRIENSMGRDMIYGIFGGHITSEGVTLTAPSAKPSRAKPD
jgi:hypothetical protein